MLPRLITKKIGLLKTAAIFAVLIVVVFLFSTTLVRAEDSIPPNTFGTQEIENTINLSGQDIRVIVVKIIRAVLGLIGIVAVSIVMYGGYTYMTSGGNEEKTTKAKKILINGVIGLVIIMSAFIIVQFIINALSGATTSRPGGGERPGPQSNFSGSGALGRIITDHYPERGQVGVKRNTKIIITFAKAIDPSTIIENTNNTCWGPVSTPVSCGTCWGLDNIQVTCDDDNDSIIVSDEPYFGDCVEDEDFSWEEDCDHLRIENIEIFRSIVDGEEKVLTPAAAMTIYDSERDANIFVFKPFEPLGDSLQDIWYNVYLTNNIELKIGDKIFSDQRAGNKFYEWEFQTDTTFDYDPPHVTTVWPREGTREEKNEIVQINFDDVMDPTSVQGLLTGNPINSFTNIVFNSPSTTGEWRVSNAYHTVEFIPDNPCGFNSCGDIMYCFDLDCPDPGDKNCSSTFKTLIRTAKLINTSTLFEAKPFTGVTDKAGNALDGNDDMIADDKPTMIGDFLSATDEEDDLDNHEDKPDNYLWNYIVENQMDRAPIYINQVSPGLDKNYVKFNIRNKEGVEIKFSKRLLSYTVDQGVSLEEYPEHEDGAIGFERRSIESDDKTITYIIPTRKLGPNDDGYYYFSITSSSIRNSSQNCLYPGRGPDGIYPDGYNTTYSPVCDIEFDEETGALVDLGENCIDVRALPDINTGCIYKINSSTAKTQPSVEACLNDLKEADVSPLFPILPRD